MVTVREGAARRRKLSVTDHPGRDTFCPLVMLKLREELILQTKITLKKTNNTYLILDIAPLDYPPLVSGIYIKAQETFAIVFHPMKHKCLSNFEVTKVTVEYVSVEIGLIKMFSLLSYESLFENLAK